MFSNFTGSVWKYLSPNEVRSLGEITLDLVSRNDICSLRWLMDGRKCMEAVAERLTWLLYPKFVHYCFTMTTLRIVSKKLANKRMTLQASDCLLRFAWAVAAVFGPSLPVLNMLIAFLSKIYTVLLFGSDSEVLDMRDGQ
eukprot:6475497-Amphidinium_carterae.1